jgi:hypothetical protein
LSETSHHWLCAIRPSAGSVGITRIWLWYHHNNKKKRNKKVRWLDIDK